MTGAIIAESGLDDVNERVYLSSYSLGLASTGV
jgi:hypothetical protein